MKRTNKLFYPTLFLLGVIAFNLTSVSLFANSQIKHKTVVFSLDNGNTINNAGPSLEALKLFVNGLMKKVSNVRGEGEPFLRRLTRVQNAHRAVNGLKEDATRAEILATVREFKSALSNFKRKIPLGDPNRDDIFSAFEILQDLLRLI